jgi:hypothetical protein
MQTTALGPLTLCLLPLAAASPQADQTDGAEGAPAVEIEVREVDLPEHEAHVIVLGGSHGDQAAQRLIWVELDGEQEELDDAGRVRVEIEREDDREQSFGARVRRGVRAIAGRRAGGARGWTARLADELDALEREIDVDELAEQLERQLEGLFRGDSGEVEMHVTIEIDEDRDEAGEGREEYEFELEFDDDRSDRGIAGWLGRLFEEEEEEVQRRGRGACEACGCDRRGHQDDAARARDWNARDWNARDWNARDWNARDWDARGWGDRGWRRQGQRRGAGRRAIPFWMEHYRDSQPGPLTPVFPPHDGGWTDRAPHPMGPEQFRGGQPQGNRAPQPMDGWEQTRRELDALRRQLDELRHLLEVR